MTAPDSLPLHARIEANLASASPDPLPAMVKTFADALMSTEAHLQPSADQLSSGVCMQVGVGYQFGDHQQNGIRCLRRAVRPAKAVQMIARPPSRLSDSTVHRKGACPAHRLH